MSEPEEKEQKKRNPLFWGLILALFPSIAYLIGISFYQGHLSAFGVSDSEFPISTQQVYLQAYYAVGSLFLTQTESIINVIRNIKGWPLGFTLAALIIIFYVILKLKEKIIQLCSQKFLSIASSISTYLHCGNNNFSKSVGIIGTASAIVLYLVSFITLVPVLWWLFCLPFYSTGKNKASTQIKTYKTEGCQPKSETGWNTCYFIINNKGKTIHEGLLLKINGNEITMFKKDGTYTFSRQKDWIIRRKLHNTP